MKRGQQIVLLVVILLLARGTFGQATQPDLSNLDLPAMAKLATTLRAAPAKVTELQALAIHVAQRYEGEATAGKVEWDQWLALVTAVGSQLPKPTQASMSAALKAKLVPNEAAAKALNDEKLAQISAALAGLGDVEGAGSLCAIWAGDAGRLKAATPEVVGQFVPTLGRAGTPELRQSVTDYVSAKFMPDVQLMQKLGPEYWNAFTWTQELSAETRSSWAESLRKAYVDDGTVLSGLSANQVSALMAVFQRLRYEHIGEVAARIMDAGSWKSWDERGIRTLATAISQARNDVTVEGKATRLRELAAFIQSTFVEDPSRIATIPIGEWSALVNSLSGALTDEQKDTWVRALRPVFGDDSKFRNGLNASGLEQLVSMLTRLRDERASGVAVDFMRGTDAWQSWTFPQIVQLASLIRRPLPEGDPTEDLRVEQFKRLINFVESKYFIPGAAAIATTTVPQWNQLVISALPLFSLEDKSKWRQQLRNAFAIGDSLASLGVDDFLSLNYMLTNLQDPQLGPLHHEYAVNAKWLKPGFPG